MTTAKPRSGASPASEPEVCVIEVRGPDGELSRKVTLSQADELVHRGYGVWHRASNGRRYVSLHESVDVNASRNWLSHNGCTTRRVRIWNADREAVSAPVITEHRGTVDHDHDD